MIRQGLPGRLYWVVACSLILVGIPAIFSVGAPLVAIGITLVILGPRRADPPVFRPPLVGVVLFFVGYVLVAPLGCTTTSAPPGGPPGSTTCSNLLGIDYSGVGYYNPSLWPAVGAGAAAAALGVVATRRLLRRR